MIPKIIHQIWLGPRAAPIEWIKRWRSLHPDWEYMLWTEKTLDFPLKCIRQYLLAATYPGKSDIARYEILKRFGGVYIDADSVCLRPIDESLLSRNMIVAYENERVRPGLVANGVLGCPPEHPVICEIVGEVSRLGRDAMGDYDFSVTGPGLLTRMLARHPETEILPSHLFYPYHYSGEQCSAAQLVEAYAVQMWCSTSASSEFEQIRRKYGYVPGKSVPITMKRQCPAALDHAVVRQNPAWKSGDRKGQIKCESDGGAIAIHLSETAYLVWELCRETIRVQELCDLLVTDFHADPDEIRVDVHEFIRDFICKEYLLIADDDND